MAQIEIYELSTSDNCGPLLLIVHIRDNSRTLNVAVDNRAVDDSFQKLKYMSGLEKGKNYFLLILRNKEHNLFSQCFLTSR